MPARTDIEKRFWDAFARRYDRFIAKTMGHSYAALYQQLATDLRTGDRVLEIATGTGLIAFELCDKVLHVEAIDISPEMIRVAQEKQQQLGKANIRFSVQDSCALEFEPASFDLAIASNVLHLLFYPEQALQEMHRVLTDKGRIILPTFCHGESIGTRLLSHLLSLAGFKARHRWSYEGFCAFVSANGFRIIRSERIPDTMPLAYVVAEKVLI